MANLVNSQIKIHIENLRDISNVQLELPFSQGLYAITGVNGVGKSTIFAALSKFVYRGALANYFRSDGDSTTKITYTLNDQTVSWVRGISWQKSDITAPDLFVDGLYEGSLIFGNRFIDAHKSRLYKTFNIRNEDLCQADQFVIENLGKILRNDKNYYQTLQKVRTKTLAENLGFSGIPYVFTKGAHTIHQHNMSSGEFLLIGLLHYLNERIKYTQRRGITSNSLVILDEIEMALHPAAQDRLAIFLNTLSSQHNFCIYFSTHSIQIISNIRAEKIFHIDRGIDNGLRVINPCYPAYATRFMYAPDGFDFILLVEDELAKNLVEKAVRDHRIQMSKLIRIIPCGGWEKTLELQHEIQSSRLAGIGCTAISILDGDIREQCETRYPRTTPYGALKKMFLPIPSLEKYIRKNLIVAPDQNFADILGDTFFRVRSLHDIIVDYRNTPASYNDNNGKGLFLVLRRCAVEQGVSEDRFKLELCNLISSYANINELGAAISRACT